MSETRYFRVSGQVQGVGFRAATLEQARRQGLAGWVRNRANGDVEVVARGSAPAMDTLRGWLGQGPPAARVTHVEEDETTVEALPEPFQIRH